MLAPALAKRIAAGQDSRSSMIIFGYPSNIVSKKNHGRDQSSSLVIR
jgi:hypothetical protein